jgi:dihydrodipicolinate synthase/N-acetylneuraminate lyase
LSNVTQDSTAVPISGVFPVLPTPFGPHGQPDIVSLRRLVRYLLRCGVDGITFPGVASELAQLSEDERRLLLEAVLAATIGVVLAILGLIVVRALFLNRALDQFYQANLIARIDYADILYIAPIMFGVGVAMAALTAYVTLRLYVRD